MGSKMSPNYANVFMHHFESKYLTQAPVQPFLWKRFIDDIFVIFTCSDEEIQSFIKWINAVHPTIKFTADINKNGVPFLMSVSTKSGAIIFGSNHPGIAYIL